MKSGDMKPEQVIEGLRRLVAAGQRAQTAVDGTIRALQQRQNKPVRLESLMLEAERACRSSSIWLEAAADELERTRTLFDGCTCDGITVCTHCKGMR